MAEELDAKTEIKKILEHYFSEQLGEGAADDIAGEIKNRVAEVYGSKMKRTIIGPERSMPPGTEIYFILKEDVEK